MLTRLHRPGPDDFGGGFARYVALVEDGAIVEVLQTQLDAAVKLLAGISEAESTVRHAPYTWSIRQVIGHVTDCERVFAYRALRMARGDATPRPGFDENAFMVASDFDAWPLAELAHEWELVRRGNLCLLKHLPQEAWQRRALVSDVPMTAKAMAYVMAGHAKHHLEIVAKRVGKEM